MPVSLIITLVGLIPQLLQEANNIRATLSTNDQATLDAALTAARAAATADVDKTIQDLKTNR